jgi:hypothetical protein
MGADREDVRQSRRRGDAEEDHPPDGEHDRAPGEEQWESFPERASTLH